MAGEILQTISKDDHECAKFRSRRKFANDRESDLNASRDAGMKVGMKAGMKAGMEKVIIAALREGASVEFIEKITGFDKRLIEEIKNKKIEKLSETQLVSYLFIVPLIGKQVN